MGEAPNDRELVALALLDDVSEIDLLAVSLSDTDADALGLLVGDAPIDKEPVALALEEDVSEIDLLAVLV